MLLPGLAPAIGFGYLLFRFLDHRAIAILIAVTTLIFVGMWLVSGGDVMVRPRSTSKAITAGVASGITTMVAHSGGPPLAMYLLPLGLSKEIYGNDKLVFYCRQCDQGGAVAAAGTTDFRQLDTDGDLPVGHSWRCMARMAASRKPRPAPDLSALLRLACRDSAKAIVGWRLGLFGVTRAAARNRFKRAALWVYSQTLPRSRHRVLTI